MSAHAPGLAHDVVGARGGHVTALETPLFDHAALGGIIMNGAGASDSDGDNADTTGAGASDSDGDNADTSGADGGVHFHACPHFAQLEIESRPCRIEVVTAATWPEIDFAIASGGSGPPPRPPQIRL